MTSIDMLTANTDATTYQTQNSTASAGAHASAKAHHGHRQAQKADSVTLSDNARSLAAARDAVQSAPDLRDQKVADIKQQISDGTYSVPSRVLARKMLDQTAQE